MKNIELKVKIDNFNRLSFLLRKLGAKAGGKLIQVDTYYKCQNGRLKLREINDRESQLVFYRRQNTKKSKVSNYEVIKVDKHKIQNLKHIFNMMFGKLVVVRKERNLWLYKNTRIHLDKVNILGNFLELETAAKNINLKDARIEHAKIIKLLNLKAYEKIEGSYSDLLLANK